MWVQAETRGRGVRGREVAGALRAAWGQGRGRIREGRGEKLEAIPQRLCNLG